MASHPPRPPSLRLGASGQAVPDHTKLLSMNSQQSLLFHHRWIRLRRTPVGLSSALIHSCMLAYPTFARRTIIGLECFHFSVRNGKRWCTLE